jgi:hypothetical protein
MRSGRGEHEEVQHAYDRAVETDPALAAWQNCGNSARVDEFETRSPPIGVPRAAAEAAPTMASAAPSALDRSMKLSLFTTSGWRWIRRTP